VGVLSARSKGPKSGERFLEGGSRPPPTRSGRSAVSSATRVRGPEKSEFGAFLDLKIASRQRIGINQYVVFIGCGNFISIHGRPMKKSNKKA